MRHRAPKNDQDQSFFFAQQSQDCEKTVVEPDLTNGLIRRLQDSDEEFDEDDVDEDEDEVTETTPPAAHSQPLSTVSSLAGALIKTEDTLNLTKNFDKEVQDLSKKSLDLAARLATTAATTSQTPLQPQQQATTISSTTPLPITSTAHGFASSATTMATSPLGVQAVPSISSAVAASSLSSSSASSVSSTTSTSPPSSATSFSALNLFQTSPPVAHTAALAVAATLASMNNGSTSNPPPSMLPLQLTSSLPSALVLPNTCLVAAAVQQKIRSVSPPPLYNKAHHPPPSAINVVMSKERSDDFPLNASSCLHGSHEHLNFTKHSYTNGFIPALKLKRPRLSEDSNFNGSSTMDTSTTPTPLVPEDDDYHYLLSLHPYMKQLTAAQKLRIRTKIQKLIFKELYKEDLEESK